MVGPANNLQVKRELVQAVKYFAAGGFSALIEWSLFFVCTSFFGIFYLYSVAIAFFFATLANYVLSARWVFRSGQRPPPVEALMVYAVSAVGLGLNFLLMWAFHGRLKFPLMPSKVLSTGIVFVWNYLSRRFLIFNAHHQHQLKE